MLCRVQPKKKALVAVCSLPCLTGVRRMSPPRHLYREENRVNDNQSSFIVKTKPMFNCLIFDGTCLRYSKQIYWSQWYLNINHSWKKWKTFFRDLFSLTKQGKGQAWGGVGGAIMWYIFFNCKMRFCWNCMASFCPLKKGRQWNLCVYINLHPFIHICKYILLLNWTSDLYMFIHMKVWWEGLENPTIKNALPPGNCIA